jgi:hypothetical protein
MGTSLGEVGQMNDIGYGESRLYVELCSHISYNINVGHHEGSQG